MAIDPVTIAGILIALGVGVFVGILAARPKIARLEATVEGERAASAKATAEHERDQAKLRETFRALSAEALQSNNRAFLDLAETRLREARAEATTDIDARKKAIEDLLTPLQQTLGRVDSDLKTAERLRIESSSQLVERIKSLDAAGQGLRTETARLVDALKRPGVRGRWGELQLKRVVELAGMVEYCDFDEQRTISNEERRMRPDVIVRLPGGTSVVVDAKVPLDAYLKALEAPDEQSRQQLLVEHARQVRTHLTQLASKGYASNVGPSPDFVVMFLPGEMFLSAALEQDPSLIEFGATGLSERVIVASPTTLIAVLRAVAYGWQQQAVAENARQISELGWNLYKSIGKLGEHFDTLGRHLKQGLEAYNNAVGSLEGNVLVKARKFKELQAANATEELPVLEPIDRVPRQLQSPELTDGLPFGDPEVVEVE